MRRLCEKPGCGQPVAVIYGLAPSGTEAGLWVDHWSPERIEEVPPPGARGVVCQKHSESLSAPRGWSFEDRREAIPRLFKTRDRGNLSAVPDPTNETLRPKDSTGATKRDVTGSIKRDGTGSTRRPRPADIPRPSLFAELDEPVVVIEPVAKVVVREEAPPVIEEIVEEEVIEILPTQDDSTELLIRQDVDTRWAPHFDPDDDLGGMLDATGSMLRDAFRSRHNGRSES